METITGSTLGDDYEKLMSTLDTIALEKLAKFKGCNNFLFDDGHALREKRGTNSVCPLITRKRKMPVLVEEDPAIRKAELAAQLAADLAAIKAANKRSMLSGGRARFSMARYSSDSSLSSCESEDDTGEEHRVVGRNRN